MKSELRLARVKAMALTHTKAHSASKEAAKGTLVREGFYTSKGALSVKYGGQSSSKKSSKASAKT